MTLHLQREPEYRLARFSASSRSDISRACAARSRRSAWRSDRSLLLRPARAAGPCRQGWRLPCCAYMGGCAIIGDARVIITRRTIVSARIVASATPGRLPVAPAALRQISIMADRRTERGIPCVAWSRLPAKAVGRRRFGAALLGSEDGSRLEPHHVDDAARAGKEHSQDPREIPHDRLSAEIDVVPESANRAMCFAQRCAPSLPCRATPGMPTWCTRVPAAER